MICPVIPGQSVDLAAHRATRKDSEELYWSSHIAALQDMPNECKDQYRKVSDDIRKSVLSISDYVQHNGLHVPSCSVGTRGCLIDSFEAYHLRYGLQSLTSLPYTVPLPTGR